MFEKVHYKIMALILDQDVHTFWNSSLYTTLVVLSMQSPFIPFLDVTRAATWVI